jgi:hypothetical protein
LNNIGCFYDDEICYGKSSDSKCSGYSTNNLACISKNNGISGGILRKEMNE